MISVTNATQMVASTVTEIVLVFCVKGVGLYKETLDPHATSLLWCFISAVCFPLTDAIRCFEHRSSNLSMITDEDYETCVVFYKFKQEEDRVNTTYVMFSGSNRSVTEAVECEISEGLDYESRKPVISNREATIAAIKQGLVYCYCHSSPTCNTEPETFENYVWGRGRRERAVLMVLTKLNVPKAKVELENFRATSSSTTAASTTTTLTTTNVPTTTTTAMTTTTQGPATTLMAEMEAMQSEEEEDDRSAMIIATGATGFACVVLIVGIITVIPCMRKIRDRRYKKWLEKTWDERVRQAAQELERQDEKLRTRRRRPSRDAGSRGKSMEMSVEEMQKAGSKDQIGSKEAGSKEPIGSKENMQIGSKEKGGGGDDPFGDYVSKMGHVDEPALPGVSRYVFDEKQKNQKDGGGRPGF